MERSAVHPRGTADHPANGLLRSTFDRTLHRVFRAAKACFGDQLNCFTDPNGNGNLDDSTPLHFTGKERDTETGEANGNDYFGARYFPSGLGRFMTPDWSAKYDPVPYASLGNPQSLNLYAYVTNNPLAVADPDGHQGGVDFGLPAPKPWDGWWYGLDDPWNQGGGDHIPNMCDFGIAGACDDYPEVGPGLPLQPSASAALPPWIAMSFLGQGPAEEEPREEAGTDGLEEPLEPLKPGELIWPSRCFGCIFPGERGPLSPFPKVEQSFKYYIGETLKEPMIVYRLWGTPAKLEGSGPGTYYSLFKPEGTEEFIRNQLSLRPEWNSMENTTSVTLPAGTTIYVGPAEAVSPYSGGGFQVYVLKP